MKYIQSYILFVLMVFALTGCHPYDDLKDDVNDLKDRVTLIEQQVKLLNDNLAVISYILDPQYKTIVNVESVTQDESITQYVITLSNDTQLTLTVGKPGTVDEPLITVGEDGIWYINGVSTSVVAVGQDGKNGEGFPEFRVEGGKWQVRFGGGAWGDVPGGNLFEGATYGDQLFESAKVEGTNLVVTLKDGTIHSLPIVQALSCAIDRTGLTFDVDNFLVMEKGERQMIPVKIEGDSPQVTYPQGWRATLQKMEEADSNGNNYLLSIYAPDAEVIVRSRAALDNTADVAVQVQKGAFWAVDKIQVKLPQDYNNNLTKYNNNLPVSVGGLDITLAVYGAAKEITADATISEGGVYFVSTNNVTLTYDLGTTGVDHLIIIPTTAAVTTINLAISKQLYFTGTLAFQNVSFTNNTVGYPLRANADDTSLVFDKCKVNNLLIGQGMIQPNTNITQMSWFEISNSDVKFSNGGLHLRIIFNLNCETLKFHNNIFYYSETPIGGIESTLMQNLKLIQATTVKDLTVTSNTFIDVESGYTGNATSGLMQLTGDITGKVNVDNNLYYYTYRRCATFIVRSNTKSPNGTVESCTNNYLYISSDYASTNGKSVTYDAIGSTAKQAFTATDADFFDISQSATFDKTNGIFVPATGYTQYGAQR